MSKINEIIEAYFIRKYSSHTTDLFNQWISAPYDREQKMEAMDEVWNGIEAKTDASTENSYQQTSKRIELFYQQSSKAKRRTAVAYWCRNIAAVLIPAVVALFLIGSWVRQDKQMQNTKITECITQRGEIKHLTLPDSSKVILNSGSVLIYPTKFSGNNREIYLNGEASFNVTKDAEHPFIVNSADMSVEVLGTTFNISAYYDNDVVTTTLRQGRVKVNMNDMKQSMFLEVNEQAIYDRANGTCTKQMVAVDEFFDWGNGNLYFHDESIHDIIPVIERRFDVDINITTSRYDKDRVTAKFVYGESIEELLSTFAHIIPGMRYKIENGTIYLY